MSKKFSIVRTIDFGKLDYEIDGYMAMTGEKNPYIFMNEDTAGAIINAYPMIHISSNEKVRYTCNAKGVTGYYTGHKVFIDNELSFGEIEVR